MRVANPVPPAAATASPAERIPSADGALRIRGLAAYFSCGVLLGVAFVKGEVATWFRIQEMFRFGDFHMFGVIGSALAMAVASLAVIDRLGLTTRDGERIRLPPKTLGSGTRYWAGGALFGAGWALTGACPGPIYALIGSGVAVFFPVLLFAMAGMWTYGQLRERLPH